MNKLTSYIENANVNDKFTYLFKHGYQTQNYTQSHCKGKCLCGLQIKVKKLCGPHREYGNQEMMLNILILYKKGLILTAIDIEIRKINSKLC